MPIELRGGGGAPPKDPRGDWRRQLKTPDHASVDWRVYYVMGYRQVTDELVAASTQESRGTMWRSRTNPDELIISFDIRDGEPPRVRGAEVYYHDEIMKLTADPHWTEPE